MTPDNQLRRTPATTETHCQVKCILIHISTQMPQAQVLAAKCLIEASPQIQNARFDLVLLGLDLSDSETVDTLRVAREASAATRFAIISAADTRGDILATLAAGLHGFISKHQSDTEILAAINDILSGRTYVPCSLAASVSQGDRETTPSRSTEVNFSKLTKRQREVLQLLARGMSNKEIARAVEIAEATKRIAVLNADEVDGGSGRRGPGSAPRLRVGGAKDHHRGRDHGRPNKAFSAVRVSCRDDASHRSALSCL